MTAPTAARPGSGPLRTTCPGSRRSRARVRGLRKMVDADTWCPDVVVQVASATRALQEVAVGLLTDHLQHCVVEAVRASEAGGQASLGEVASTIPQVIRL